MELIQTGVGILNLPRLHSGKTGRLVLQARPSGGASYSIEARAHPNAPFKDIVVARTSDLPPGSYDWMPELRLNVTVGGSVTLWVAETVD